MAKFRLVNWEVYAQDYDIEAPDWESAVEQFCGGEKGCKVKGEPRFISTFEGQSYELNDSVFILDETTGEPDYEATTVLNELEIQNDA